MDATSFSSAWTIEHHLYMKYESPAAMSSNHVTEKLTIGHNHSSRFVVFIGGRFSDFFHQHVVDVEAFQCLQQDSRPLVLVAGEEVHQRSFWLKITKNIKLYAQMYMYMYL